MREERLATGPERHPHAKASRTTQDGGVTIARSKPQILDSWAVRCP